MSNLSRYAALHRMTTELNVEAEIDNSANLSDDRQVVAAVGGAVMALGMGLTELATEEKLTDAQVESLVVVADLLSIPTSNGFSAIFEMSKELESSTSVKDIADDEEGYNIFTMGLEQVGEYVKARPKPTPLAEAAAE